MREQRWNDAMYWPLVVASVAFIVAYSWQVIADLQGPQHTTARIVMFVTWIIFAIDYVVRLLLTESRWRWFWKHLFDLAVVVVPAARPLRMLKALTAIHALQRTAGDALRNSIAIYGSGAAIILIWMAALAVLEVERPAEGANITNFGDAVWWAFVTITTVGYGDFVPVTLNGRIIAVLLMCGGIALVSIITGSLASWVVERATGGNDEAHGASRADVRALSDQVAALAARLEAGDQGSGPAK